MLKYNNAKRCTFQAMHMVVFPCDIHLGATRTISPQGLMDTGFHQA